MNRLEKVLLVIAVALAAVIVALVIAAAGKPDPVPPVVSTDEAVGKCIQGQRVFYHVTRGEAAETCLADLQVDGERSFVREWSNFKTEDDLW